MKKSFSFFSLIIICVLLAVGCSEENNNYSSDLDAHKRDLDGYFFDSGRYQLYFKDDKMMINGRDIGKDKKSVLDEIYLNKGVELGGTVMEEYENVEVTTNDNKYTIKVDDFTLEFTKFKDHIIVDSENMEFIRNKLEI
ncbi:protein-disulfide isomerase [Solibacillus merdavium]|uniref:Protein-disulfide isomerase n=1 Tax=Solibacillus merdavium TaxID=2762218 RepID=A0ABR8XKD6_9BACL|nr:protein-disulfide isomerase [Solibacillus merdavium]MBD8032410.1 protein-disulfide isomerase [Solibacillus merdavium]